MGGGDEADEATWTASVEEMNFPTLHIVVHK